MAKASELSLITVIYSDVKLINEFNNLFARFNNKGGGTETTIPLTVEKQLLTLSTIDVQCTLSRINPRKRVGLEDN